MELRGSALTSNADLPLLYFGVTRPRALALCLAAFGAVFAFIGAANHYRSQRSAPVPMARESLRLAHALLDERRATLAAIAAAEDLRGAGSAACARLRQAHPEFSGIGAWRSGDWPDGRLTRFEGAGPELQLAVKLPNAEPGSGNQMLSGVVRLQDLSKSLAAYAAHVPGCDIFVLDAHGGPIAASRPDPLPADFVQMMTTQLADEGDAQVALTDGRRRRVGYAKDKDLGWIAVVAAPTPR